MVAAATKLLGSLLGEPVIVCVVSIASILSLFEIRMTLELKEIAWKKPVSISQKHATTPHTALTFKQSDFTSKCLQIQVEYP